MKHMHFVYCEANYLILNNSQINYLTMQEHLLSTNTMLRMRSDEMSALMHSDEMSALRTYFISFNMKNKFRQLCQKYDNNCPSSIFMKNNVDYITVQSVEDCWTPETQLTFY